MFCFSQGPYSAFLGKTTTGTSLDFAFCRSEAGHYQVPMISLHFDTGTFHIGTLGTPKRLRLHRGFRTGGLGLVLVSEGKILLFELAELLGALLQLLGVFVELFLQDLEPRGKLGIGLFPSSMQPGYLTLQIVDLPLEFGFSMGSFGTVDKASICIDLQVKLFHIRKYGRFSLSEVFHFPEEGGDPWTGPGKIHSGEPGFLLAEILGTRWLNHQTGSWDPAVTLEQYKTVKTIEAELLGLPAPSLNDEHEIPGPAEAEKTPEPTDDDPPAE
ncbi:hypothetical protein F2Q68_00020658 [Brassica cretica]|uniref:Uncharacterized protein n=1 Tax=Brassica cretica TaxID=69181 RepID=A0A8S9FYG1_BRACR|nr:hypothetical protein F2Q68_00020658 [Brassica cretica]